jgi:hypothetical protein
MAKKEVIANIMRMADWTSSHSYSAFRWVVFVGLCLVRVAAAVSVKSRFVPTDVHP